MDRDNHMAGKIIPCIEKGGLFLGASTERVCWRLAPFHLPTETRPRWPSAMGWGMMERQQNGRRTR
jgi:hypothetical protein